MLAMRALLKPIIGLYIHLNVGDRKKLTCYIMNTREFVEKIRNLVAEAETEEAIKLFLNYPNDYEDEIILKSTQYQYLIKDARLGIITQEEIEVKRTRICKSLLEFANEIDKQMNPKRDFYLSSELEEILALAEYQSRKDSRPVTSTRYFFSALTKIRPDLLRPIIEELEKLGALPHDIDEDTLSIPRELSSSRQFSSCVTSSLNELKEVTSENDPIETEDLFIDVAKYGTGASVRRLRANGITREKVDELVHTQTLELKRRR